MDPRDIETLRGLTDFPALVGYLRDELDWPIEVEQADEITFEYDPAELGIDPKHAVRIESIKQVRPLVDNQPWGIFFIEFETKRLPVVVLRRVLRALVPKSRSRDPDRPVWRMSDLLFISAQGEAGQRSISFAHFHQRQGRLPELRTFSWDSHESHFFYLQNLNLEALRWPAPEVEAQATAWREQWGQAFTVEHRYVIQTSQMLAREMARQARTVRELVEEIYDLEAVGGPLHRLYDSFKEVLLHDLTPVAFADMVAQTVAYGLFSAATQSDELTTIQQMVEMMPNTNPFLKNLLSELTTEGAVDLEELGVGQLVELLWQTDFDAILQDFGRQSGGGRQDPVVHFYELFLREYDPHQKVKRGVFYTPDPVVSYIVRSVDYLLKTEFGLEDGLADTSVDPETGEPVVQILDPAAGTGTFLAHAIDQIEATVKVKRDVDWNSYVAEHLLPRLNGFELMMAPYAVAHMKLGLKLKQTGYDFGSGERLRVYLTNTLEEPVEMHERLALTGFLSKESSAAARVKRQAPITVVIGNPPYAGHSANESEWIAGLLRGMDGQGQRVESYFEVDGHGLNERNPKWLNDDYVKFIRFGQWRIDQTGAGILAFITNNGYLDYPTFRGMRQSLMTNFDTVFVLDLHGSLKKREMTPSGDPDENVFDIQPGVAILLAVKRPARTFNVPGTSRILHADLWGSRERKYRQLEKMSIQATKWDPLDPRPPFYLFVPQDADLQTEFYEGYKVTEVFPRNSVGIVTARDRLTIRWSSQEVWDAVQDLAGLSIEQARERYSLGQDVQDWKVSLAQDDIRSSGPTRGKVVPVSYRPFDTRFTYYTGRSRGFICRPRSEVMLHMLQPANVALIVGRSGAVTGDVEWNVLGVSCQIADLNYYRRGGGQLHPLYVYPKVEAWQGRQKQFHDFSPWSPDEHQRTPNLDPMFVQDLETHLDMQFSAEGRGELSETFGPADVFHYAYAVFHSPAYRVRYADFLRRDFPHLPLTSDLKLFRLLCARGADLVALHLLEYDYLAASWSQQGQVSPLRCPITSFVERTSGTTMGAFSKSRCYEDGRVYLDTASPKMSSYFDGVPEEAWNFHIGGYQVLHKWLYDRRGTKGQPGRTLTEQDIAHYQRIVVALKETIRLMGEIDEVIEEHGGWPIQ